MWLIALFFFFPFVLDLVTTWTLVTIVIVTAPIWLIAFIIYLIYIAKFAPPSPEELETNRIYQKHQAASKARRDFWEEQDKFNRKYGVH
ncbi:MAG: hypothetical protein GYA87_05610 [Christensenellaceae bacterium]|nr:hypothetical protein [Christensenellaceae bacterium]